MTELELKIEGQGFLSTSTDILLSKYGDLLQISGERERKLSWRLLSCPEHFKTEDFSEPTDRNKLHRYLIALDDFNSDFFVPHAIQILPPSFMKAFFKDSFVLNSVMIDLETEIESHRCLVLSKNFVFEFSDESNISEGVLPLGYCHASQLQIIESDTQKLCVLFKVFAKRFVICLSCESDLLHFLNIKNDDSLDEEKYSLIARGKFTLVVGNPNEKKALKIIEKHEFIDEVLAGHEDVASVIREIAITSMVSQASNVFVECFQIKETISDLTFEMELMHGQNLFDVIMNERKLSEDETRRIVLSIAAALVHLKRMKIAHRDLKLSNIVFTSQDRRQAKLVDFGLAMLEDDEGFISGKCGTPGYIAPEILRLPSGERYMNVVDEFSLGVITYLCLTGQEPFHGKRDSDVLHSNKKCDEGAIHMGLQISRTSQRFIEIVMKMMDSNPKSRIKADEIVNFDWEIVFFNRSMCLIV